MATLIDSLKQQWKQLGKQGREVRKQHPQCFRQKDETRTEFISRFYKFSEEEKAIDDFSFPRQQIFECLKHLEQDELPSRFAEGSDIPEVKAIYTRQDAAREKRRVELREKAEIDFPIDDAAWQQEIESRNQKELDRQDKLRAFRAQRVK